MSSTAIELTFNGINGSTGRPLVESLSPKDVAQLACEESVSAETIAELREYWQERNEDQMGLIFGESDSALTASGWGIVFPLNVSPAIRLP